MAGATEEHPPAPEPGDAAADFALSCFESAWCGLRDALNWPRTLRAIVGNAVIRRRVWDCFKLNGWFLLTLITYSQGLQWVLSSWIGLTYAKDDPSAAMLQSYLHTGVDSLFHVAWVLPVYLLSVAINLLWCQEIADAAATDASPTSAPSAPGLSVEVATLVYSSILLIVFKLQSTVISCIPYIGNALALVSFCWLTAYWSFEYKWARVQPSLQKRVFFFQDRWAYFLGFGFPCTLICFFLPFAESNCIFGLVFPMHVIMATWAKPERHALRYAVPMFLGPQWALNRLIPWERVKRRLTKKRS